MEKDFEIEAVVEGKVQGVMFRDFVKKRADELGLAGIVRNTPEGDVEVLAQGEKAKLEEFIRLLRKGPIFSRVDNVEVTWHDDISDPFTEFAIGD